MTYNNIFYNGSVYNEDPFFVSEAEKADIEFDGFSLQSSDIVMSTIEIESMPARSLDTVDVPRDHGQILLGAYFRQKKIKMTGKIFGTDSSDLEQKIFELKKSLVGVNKYLDIRRGSLIIRHIATLGNPEACIMRYNEPFKITYADLNFEFICFVPFGESLKYDSDSHFGLNDLTFDFECENLGIYETPAVFLVILNAVNSITDIEIENKTTGEKIKVTSTFSVGDLLEINGENMEALLNGSACDYDGNFPKFANGVNSVTITLTGTSATYDLTPKWRKRYT